MTTEIDVKAGHGWAVRVTAINPKTGETIETYGGIVPAGETRPFIVHSHQDLLVHEMQPEEVTDSADVRPVDPREGAAQAKATGRRTS